eukprot:CAMPEP_0203671360 /NCGR_PEP_ID=MMETSP0090-20130426/7164_1 /ASSEMBLY_ACC=CAM_ASM_001088 /TAXON_ID=426623 /ORGANISM="Chaetoceros affinis, Strain CCMP159" /LENGTH=419 /DNA_ID=CAMNT_0050536419 /DNA_START=90 /DNA_END=1346 /DNA_ORIENTATION=+
MTETELVYSLFIAFPPALSLLYIVAVQAFLASGHECSWLHFARPTTIRLTLLILAIAIVITFPDNNSASNQDNDDSITTNMTPYLLPAVTMPIISTILIYRTRMLLIQGPVPKHKNLDGKVVLVTGANTGIGKETARQMLDMGATVIMACRSEKRARDAIEDILNSVNERNDKLLKSSFKAAKERLLFLQCDVSDFVSVRKAVSEFREMGLPLHVLVNNAGIIMGQRRTTTGDNKGLELTMACNHLGHFLLTNLFLPIMRKEKGSRVVVVTSSTYVLATKGIDLEDLNCERRRYTMFSQYAQSKLANILMGKELYRREMEVSRDQSKKDSFPVSVYMVHPGLVRTDVVRNMPWYLKYPNILFSFVLTTLQKSPAAGAYTSVFCATADDAEQFNGEYLSNSEVVPTNKYANDVDDARELW